MSNFDILFVGDLHLHERKEFSETNETGLSSRLREGKSILTQIQNLVAKYKIPYVIFTGDIFEKKDNLPNHLLVTFADAVDQMLVEPYRQIFVLKGNHDYKLPDYPVLRSILKKRFHLVYSTYEKHKFFSGAFTKSPLAFQVAFLPFKRKFEDFKNSWEALHDSPVPYHILIFHQELPGAYYRDKTIVKGTFDLPLFPDCLYIGGHLHNKQILTVKQENGFNKDIHFIGTPYHIDFKDIGQEKQVFLYNHETKEFRGITLDFPLFKDVKIEDVTQDMSEIDGNYIRLSGEVNIEDRYKIQEYKQDLLNKGAKGVSLNISYKSKKVLRISSDRADSASVFTEFVSKMATDLNREKLIEKGREIMGGTS